MTTPQPARHRSIERQLLWRLAVVLAFSFVLFGVFYALFVQQDARGHVADQATDVALEVGERIVPIASGGFRFIPGTAEFAAARAPALIAAIDTASGAAVQGSAEALLPRLRATVGGTQSLTEIAAGADGALHLLAAIEVVQGHTHFLVGVQLPATATGLALSGLVDEFSEEILPTFGPAILLALLIAWATIRHALKPLHRASREAASVSVERPGQRVSAAGMPAEVVPLIGAVNGAFAALENAIAVQTRFTANAAHEMRTPLAVIGARLDALAPTAARAALRGDVDRLARLVSQLLSTARLQAGEVGRLDVIDLAALARSTLAGLATLAIARGREVVLDAAGPVMVRGNAVALEGVFINLVENALRFTPVGTAVEVTVGPGPVFSVRDHGPGVAQADRAQVFEPFWRAAGQTSLGQTGGGAGLGLAIVRETVGLHGGQISVSAADGGGAVFSVRLQAVLPATGAQVGGPAEPARPALVAVTP